MEIERKYFISVLILLLLDFLWINLFMGKRYKKMVKNIQNAEMDANYLPIIGAYSLMIVGLVLFVIPNITKENRFFDSLKYGFLFGFVAYGIYDLTCASVFTKWDMKLGIIDMIWGGFVYFCAAYFGSL